MSLEEKFEQAVRRLDIDQEDREVLLNGGLRFLVSEEFHRYDNWGKAINKTKILIVLHAVVCVNGMFHAFGRTGGGTRITNIDMANATGGGKSTTKTYRDQCNEIEELVKHCLNL